MSHGETESTEKGNYGITERWYQVFAKSHDGGNTFDEVITFDSDPESIDTVGMQGDFVFAHGDSVYVLWRSEYYDGTTQSFKTYLAYSNNKGKDFFTEPVSLNDRLSQYGSIISKIGDDSLYQIALTQKNSPFNDAAAYFSDFSFDSTEVPVDILKDISTQSGSMPDFVADKNNIHFVTQGDYGKNCILYSFSGDGGKSFGDVVNISPNGNSTDCLGIVPDALSPVKQAMSGVDYQDVRCKDDRLIGYILSLRERGGLPVCVTTNSYGEMVKRGYLLENAQELLSLHAAEKFVLASPTFLDGGIEDSLDLHIVNSRKSIPPIVTVSGAFDVSHSAQIPRDGPSQSVIETPETKNITIQVAQINRIHSAIIDDKWDEIKQDHADRESQRNSLYRISSGPTSHIVLTIGDAINQRGMIPITISEISENVSDKITFWQFQPIRHDGDNRGKTWDFLPDSHRQNWEFLDENGNDAWDDSEIPRDQFGITLEGHRYPAFCGDERVEGESWSPSTIPIKPGSETVTAKSGQLGYLPDSEGVYTIRYVSLFETNAELPDDAEMIENQTSLCVLEDARKDAMHAYYTYLKFKLNNITVNSYLEPESPKLPTNTQINPGAPVGHELGDDHQHASILVKIFGDKFDFSHPDYQIKAPWIHFEAQDGNTIHRHSKGITLGYLFDTLNLGLSSNCFVFHDGREFCTNEDYTLKFYINGDKVSDIRDYVIMNDDRILVSYGPEDTDEIDSQLAELESQELGY